MFMFSVIQVEDSDLFVTRAILVEVVRSDKDTVVGSMYVGLATLMCIRYPKRSIVQDTRASSSTVPSKGAHSQARERPEQRISWLQIAPGFHSVGTIPR